MLSKNEKIRYKKKNNIAVYVVAEKKFHDFVYVCMYGTPGTNH